MANYAFIDGNNLIRGVKAIGWSGLDMRRFRRYLSDKYDVEKAYYFIGYIRSNDKLYQSLRRDGFHLVFKEVLLRDGEMKGNVDAELVLHTMIELMNGSFERAVIVAGDGDYCCLSRFLEERDRLEVVLAPNQRYCSRLLKKKVKRLAFMDNLRGKLELRKRSGEDVPRDRPLRDSSPS